MSKIKYIYIHKSEENQERKINNTRYIEENARSKRNLIQGFYYLGEAYAGVFGKISKSINLDFSPFLKP